MEQTPTAPKPAETTPNNTTTGQVAKIPATEDPNRNDKGQFVKGHKPKTSFADRPQDRSNGHWDSRKTLSFQYKKFMNMSVEDFKKWGQEVPQSERTMAEEIAYARVNEARGSAKRGLKTTIEITDRTEGKATQYIESRTEITNPYDDLTTEQLEALAKQAENR